LKDPAIDVRIILRWFFRKRDGGVDCFDLAQDGEKWQPVVNTTSNSGVP
jgi:hypothetical protein